MSASDWGRIEAIVAGALERDSAARPAYLEEACGQDRALRQEVESLIACDTVAGDSIASAVQEGARRVLGVDPGFAEGQRIGVYRVIREIGHGGMGTVYLAQRDDDQFQKEVALKVVTRGMDTAALLSRFRHERQILARLEHPYIARLLDGGSTPDGRPYLVMEYVKGQPITNWCADRDMGIAPRVELFRKVCAAVQSAHQNLVVHRDLKPGNILVDDDGTPKLLDFGIAKLLGADSGPQMTIEASGAPMFTPDYASPEQVRARAITTASDVYSLGAILYELLAGVRPHRLAACTQADIERAVCQEQPSKPSTASQRAAAGGGEAVRPPLLPAGDLDNIVMTAMQKEPARRYVSAAAFSEDLRRYLEGLPVKAREATFFYRTGKFARRHRVSVAAVVLLVASLAGGVTVSTIEARRAERRFNEVRRMAHAVLYDIYDAIRDLQGSAKAREVVVKTELGYLDGLAREAAGDPGIQLELAEAYARVADVQGGARGTRNLGMTAAALQSYRKAMSLADGLTGPTGVSDQANLIRMRVRVQLGSVAAASNIPAALKLYQEGIAIGEAAVHRGHAGVEIMRMLSELYAVMARDQPDNALGISSSRKGVALLEELAARQPVNESLQIDLAERYSNLSSRLARRGLTADALDGARAVVRIREKLAAAHPLNASYRRELMIGYSKVGDAWLATLEQRGPATSEALKSYGQALTVAEDLAAAEPEDRRAAYDLGMALWKTAGAVPDDGDNAAALTVLRRAMTIFKTLTAQDTADQRMRRMLAGSLMSMGERQEPLGDAAGAIHSLRESVRIDEALVKKNPSEILAVDYLYRSYRDLARVLAAAGQRTEALEASARSVQSARAAALLDPSNPLTQSKLPVAHNAAGAVQSTLATLPGAPDAQRREDWRAARDSYQNAAGLWEQMKVPPMGSTDPDAEAKKARAEAARCAQALAAMR